jgi:hypothetical protein
VRARTRRASLRPSLFTRMRLAGAAAAIGALATLVLIGPPEHAIAATNNYNQITGAGSTDSAVTAQWTQGLLNSSNQPITGDSADPASNSARQAGTGPLSFMYGDFKNLSVTVSQTQDITHQGVTVSWTGGEPTIEEGGGQANFLQMMECYGDAATGPDPEDCEFGSAGPLATAPNSPIADRSGPLCVAGAVPSTSSPPAAENGLPAPYGCDTMEPGSASPPHVQPTGEPPGDFTIPFVPISDPSSPAYGQAADSAYFDQFTSDEVQRAVTNSDGTGQLQFETLTGTEAPGLGCGVPESDGQARGCWLVIVPRGQYEPNGYKVAGFDGVGSFLNTSPLSASNWAQRIQIHLDFAPVQVFCPIGTQERETVGTQIAARAVQSWQLALNKQANCSKVYGYSATPEATSTQELSESGSGIGLAFTTIPIGSEAARDASSGNTGGTLNLPPMLYAPVAVSALAFGFNINQASGYVSTPMKLTPQLLAQSLTQTYLSDLPDYYPYQPGFPGPSWAQKNPLNISSDPQFEALNPEVTPYTLFSTPLAPLLTEDHSALNQSVWQWIQADPAVDTWLDSTTDAAQTLTVDPGYQKLQLGKAPAIDSFPRAYQVDNTSGCLDLGQSPGTPPKEELKCSLDLLPYSNNYETAAQSVLTGANSSAAQWSAAATGPDGTPGWWMPTGQEGLGSVFMWTTADTPDLAAFGLIDAALCNDAGSDCVGPSTASVTTALDSATKDSAGLLEVDPANPGNGGYPLVQVTYAAVPTNQSAAALQDYAALIKYAAGPGQTVGVAPGDLPPGYLPLPATLATQAKAVATKLLADAAAKSGSAGPSGAPTTRTSQPARAGSVASSSGGTSAVSQSTPAASATSSAYGIKGPTAELAAITTPRQPVGAVRWTLLAVALVGAGCAVGGTVLRSARVPRWLHRLRP